MQGKTIELGRIDPFETPNEIIYLGKDHQRVTDTTRKSLRIFSFKCGIRV